MDLCTVVFRDELDILKTQAHSIARWVDNVDTIYVIVNDDVDVVSLIDPQDWRHYADRVRIVHRSVFGNYWNSNGWVSQQVLKLCAASLSQSRWCVALDAKTIFVKYLPEIDQGSRLAVGTLPVYEVFEPSRQIVNTLWDVDLQRQLGPGGVPFWFDPREVRAMIADVESRTGQNFVPWFQDQGRLTEFILYSGWMERCYGLDYVVTDSKIQPCNLCHSEIDSVDLKLKAMHLAHTVSIHRRAWEQMTIQQKQSYHNLLNERLYQ